MPISSSAVAVPPSREILTQAMNEALSPPILEPVVDPVLETESIMVNGIDQNNLEKNEPEIEQDVIYIPPRKNLSIASELDKESDHSLKLNTPQKF